MLPQSDAYSSSASQRPDTGFTQTENHRPPDRRVPCLGSVGERPAGTSRVFGGAGFSLATPDFRHLEILRRTGARPISDKATERRTGEPTSAILPPAARHLQDQKDHLRKHMFQVHLEWFPRLRRLARRVLGSDEKARSRGAYLRHGLRMRSEDRPTRCMRLIGRYPEFDRPAADALLLLLRESGGFQVCTAEGQRRGRLTRRVTASNSSPSPNASGPWPRTTQTQAAKDGECLDSLPIRTTTEVYRSVVGLLPVQRRCAPAVGTCRRGQRARASPLTEKTAA